MKKLSSKQRYPKHCPLACWDFPEDVEVTKESKVVFDVDKIDCQCCVPAHMIKFNKNTYVSCPEIRTDAPHYTDCEIFSQWIWKGKYQNNNYLKKNNKRNPLDSRLRHECFKRDDYKCVECGATKDEKMLHCDHILPVSQGGSDELENLQTLCDDCNLSKSNKKWIGGKEIETKT